MCSRQIVEMCLIAQLVGIHTHCTYISTNICHILLLLSMLGMIISFCIHLLGFTILLTVKNKHNLGPQKEPLKIQVFCLVLYQGIYNSLSWGRDSGDLFIYSIDSFNFTPDQHVTDSKNEILVPPGGSENNGMHKALPSHKNIYKGLMPILSTATATASASTCISSTGTHTIRASTIEAEEN